MASLCLLFAKDYRIYSYVHDFDGGKSILRAIVRGGALKIETFLGPKMATSEPSAIRGQKVEIFRAHPFQWPAKWIFPHRNHVH